MSVQQYQELFDVRTKYLDNHFSSYFLTTKFSGEDGFFEEYICSGYGRIIMMGFIFNYGSRTVRILEGRPCLTAGFGKMGELVIKSDIDLSTFPGML